MDKKKVIKQRHISNIGFTLIELLAVIIILVVIALITVPTILNIVDSSRKAAFSDSVISMFKAANLEVTLDERPNEYRDYVKHLNLSNQKFDGIWKYVDKIIYLCGVTDGKYIVVGEQIGEDEDCISSNQFAVLKLEGENVKPVITVEPLTMIHVIGDEFDIMEGVSATDNRGRDITGNIVMSTEGSLTTAGIYMIKYNVEDNLNTAAIEMIRIVYVMESVGTFRLEDEADINSNGWGKNDYNVIFKKGESIVSYTYQISINGEPYGEVMEAVDDIIPITEESDNIVIKVTVIDDKGISKSIESTVYKLDKTAPIIELEGGNMTILQNLPFQDPGYTVHDNFTLDEQIIKDSISTVVPTIIGIYGITYTATDLAGNTTTLSRRVSVAADTRFYDQMMAIQDLIADIIRYNRVKIGYSLDANDETVTVRGIDYKNYWYRISVDDIIDYINNLEGQSNLPANTIAMIDKMKATNINESNGYGDFIVRYEYTPGAVFSIPGAIINGSPVHTYNYTGDPVEHKLHTDGLLTGVTNESTKNADYWGEFSNLYRQSESSAKVFGGGEYNSSDGGLILGNKISEMLVDSSDRTKPIDERYTVGFTIKGIYPQNIDAYARTVVAVSEGNGKYLCWIGFNGHYLHVYTFHTTSVQGSVAKANQHYKEAGFMSLDLRLAKKENGDYYTVEELTNQFLNIQVTAERSTVGSERAAKVYINGVLFETGITNTNALTYTSITIGDLRPGRGLKYQGNIYNFVMYSEILDANEVKKNWEYFKNDLDIK